MWCISNDDGLFWSNTDGWVNYCICDIFTDDEHDRLHLPVGGSWRKTLGGPKIYP